MAKARQQEEITKAKLGIRARQDAVAFILEKYNDEFVRLHEENRVKAGLTRTPQGESPDELREKLAKAEARAEAWRKRLEAAEADQELVRSR